MITAQNINANRLGHNREWENSRLDNENLYRLDKNRVCLGTLYHCISEIYLYHIKAVAHATIFP